MVCGGAVPSNGREQAGSQFLPENARGVIEIVKRVTGERPTWWWNKMRLSLFHARHYYFHRLFERQNRWGCVGKSARAPNFGGCLLEFLEKYLES